MALFGKKRQESDTQSDLASPTVTLKDGSNVQADRTVDCIGDSCPRPQLMTRKALREAAAGEIVVVLIDNPTSLEAIPPMLPDLCAEHLGTVRDVRHWQVVIRKAVT